MVPWMKIICGLLFWWISYIRVRINYHFLNSFDFQTIQIESIPKFISWLGSWLAPYLNIYWALEFWSRTEYYRMIKFALQYLAGQCSQSFSNSKPSTIPPMWRNFDLYSKATIWKCRLNFKGQTLLNEWNCAWIWNILFVNKSKP